MRYSNKKINPVREPRSLTSCADDCFKPRSDLSLDTRRLKSMVFSNGVKLDKSQADSILRILLEAGLLKRVRRSGWWVVGVNDPETVAEHSFRAGLIGYFLAKQESVDVYKVLVMTLFNDLHEARINDLHKMGQRYIDFPSAEKKAFKDQLRGLNKEVVSELENLRFELDTQASKEAIVARDADILECLLQAKEYCEQGVRLAKNFFKVAPAKLKTRSAKLLWALINKCAVDKWWQAISEFKR